MLGNLNGPTLVVILLIVLLLFGAPKLPGLAKSLGQSMRILKKEVRSDQEDSERASEAESVHEESGSEAKPAPKQEPEAGSSADRT